mgnify:CR=1 FL=1
MIYHTSAHGRVGEAIYQDEATCVAVFNIGIKRDAAINTNGAFGDFVKFDRFTGLFFQRVYIYLMLKIRDGCRDRLITDF